MGVIAVQAGVGAHVIDTNPADAKQALARYLRPLGEYQSVGVGATFDPTAEICDNMIDDDGNGKVDCDDPGCKDTMGCRPEKAKTLDLFVMSQCPYGAQALVAMKDVADSFQKDLTLNVHYIGGVQGEQLTSMHGPGEVDEDVRQLCAIKHYPKNNKFLDYVSCRSKDPRNVDWKRALSFAGATAKKTAVTIGRIASSRKSFSENSTAAAAHAPTVALRVNVTTIATASAGITAAAQIRSLLPNSTRASAVQSTSISSPEYVM